METLKKVLTNQYFPAAAVLTAVILFWAVGLLGGLSLLHNNQPPLTTLTWMLFVYGAAVLTPLAGMLAAADLLRRWRRNRAAAVETAVETADGGAYVSAAVPERAAEAALPAEAAGARHEQNQHAEGPNQYAERPAQRQAAAKRPGIKKPAPKKAGSKKAA
ncbi:hypothetical protein [Arthrobacter nitrophenolicus]|uniref:Uncharacterized protein n=2 Tax=Arthrobacter nitrophenolicus TaxID=683150 RepID=L8TS03_9MICC|nr:hypothetical protein [Arthrobacter nitrophenolicus]ELT44446.1 hypothetical protein G205_11920 [Arthrobacter nitrophenolicus]